MSKIIKKPRKRHKITKSQRRSYKIAKDTGLIDSIEKFIPQVIEKFGPHTRRELEERTKLRTTTLTKSLNNLVKAGVLIVADDLVKCAYTQRPVQLYSLVN